MLPIFKGMRESCFIAVLLIVDPSSFCLAVSRDNTAYWGELFVILPYMIHNVK